MELAVFQNASVIYVGREESEMVFDGVIEQGSYVAFGFFLTEDFLLDELIDIIKVAGFCHSVIMASMRKLFPNLGPGFAKVEEALHVRGWNDLILKAAEEKDGNFLNGWEDLITRPKLMAKHGEILRRRQDTAAVSDCM